MVVVALTLRQSVPKGVDTNKCINLQHGVSHDYEIQSLCH